MTFYDYIASLSNDEIKQYADDCGTTVLYLRNHLKGGRKVPRPPLMEALWVNSGGKLSRQDVLDHFFPTSKGGEAA